MLQAIRSKAGSRVVKGLFVVLIATFGIWGIGDIFRNRGSDTVVATVDGTAIGADTLESALRSALERMQQQTGTPVDFRQARSSSGCSTTSSPSSSTSAWWSGRRRGSSS